MPREHFSVEGSTSFSAVRPGGRVHVIGVCGVAMAQLAVALARQGYAVSGSDKEFYDPMGSLLRASNVRLHQGYDAAHVEGDVELVVIANAMFYDNPEVQEVERRRLPYSSFPQVVGEALIGDRHSIVVAGTHGKTTTSALLASVLHKAGLDPSYFIGGVALDLPVSLHVGAGRWSVVEGDEYHTAFYAKVPKFCFYRPRTVLLTSVEFDHADIYPTLADVIEAFRGLLRSTPDDGLAVCCTDFPEVRRLVDQEERSRPYRVVTYGTADDADYRVVERRQEGPRQFVTVQTRAHGTLVLDLPLTGDHNAANATGCLAVLLENGVDGALVLEHLATYRPVKRRQQVRFDGDVTLIEDFAHHPTAVDVTVRGVREAYPGRRLWAVFEPRSNTSRRKVFRDAYERAFDAADRVVLADVAAGESRMNQAVELIDVSDLARAIDARGRPAKALVGADAIRDALLAELRPGDVVLLMSNGSFGGLPAALETAFRARFAPTAGGSWPVRYGAPVLAP